MKKALLLGAILIFSTISAQAMEVDSFEQESSLVPLKMLPNQEKGYAQFEGMKEAVPLCSLKKSDISGVLEGFTSSRFQKRLNKNRVYFAKGGIKNAIGSFVNVKGLYVIAYDGMCYIQKRDPGHPSVGGGGAALCAGELTVVEGKITSINNASGRYRTSTYGLYHVLWGLNNTYKVFSKNECAIEPFGERSFNSIDSFFETLRPCRPPLSFERDSNSYLVLCTYAMLTSRGILNFLQKDLQAYFDEAVGYLDEWEDDLLLLVERYYLKKIIVRNSLHAEKIKKCVSHKIEEVKEKNNPLLSEKWKKHYEKHKISAESETCLALLKQLKSCKEQQIKKLEGLEIEVWEEENENPSHPEVIS